MLAFPRKTTCGQRRALLEAGAFDAAGSLDLTCHGVLSFIHSRCLAQRTSAKSSMSAFTSEKIAFVVNGDACEVTTPPDRPLLDVLREDLEITSCKYGCGEMQCGACSVLVNGDRVFSCRTPIRSIAGKAVRTVESLEQNGKRHPVQQAFLDEEGFQCGYCTCGMIMTVVALLEKNPQPDEGEIKAALQGNLCRCCAYPNILRAVGRAALEVRP